MVCEFIDSFLEGDKESLERYQEVKLLLIPVLVSRKYLSLLFRILL